MLVYYAKRRRILKHNRKTFMTVSAEKQQLYAKLHDWMYQESLRTNHTPLPKELEDPAEWAAFCEWRHQNWLQLGEKFLTKFDQWLAEKESRESLPTLALAETPPPYPSKT